jgi:hypothetical protein
MFSSRPQGRLFCVFARSQRHHRAAAANRQRWLFLAAIRLFLVIVQTARKSRKCPVRQREKTT